MHDNQQNGDDTDKVSLSDLGFTRKVSTCQTVFGKVRHWQNIRPFEWMFLAVSLTSTVTSLAITIDRLATVKSDTQDFTFAILLTANTVFCFYYIIHGVFQERPFEVLVFVITTIVVMIYLVINFADTSRTQETVKLVRIILMSILGPINIAMGTVLSRRYWKSNNLVFRIVGGAEEMQRICKIFFLAGGLIMFDFQCQVSALILALKNGTAVTETQTIILSVGSVLTVVWPILGFLAIRMESKPAVWVFWVTSPLAPMYIIYKFVDTAKTMDTSQVLFEVNFSAGIFALVFRVFLILSMILVYKNFGKGFREKIHFASAGNKAPNARDSYVKYPSPDTQYSTMRLQY